MIAQRMVLAAPLAAASLDVGAYDFGSRVALNGVAAAATQCLNASGAADTTDLCRTAAVLQPEVSVRLSRSDELLLKLGFAKGKGINHHSPLAVPPWAADLENDVENISGRGRDHLLTLWYKHEFDLSGDQRLAVTAGIIDATDYLDENAYANDEYTQFMNPALTNGPNVFLPSYDAGVALQWHHGPWAFHGVYMDLGENDDGNDFRFYGAQIRYSLENRHGPANYRLVLAGADRQFLNPGGTKLKDRAGALLSIDQAFGESLGGWLRLGWQTEKAAVDYRAIVSGGIDLKGPAWNRPDDNIGVGYAYLDGGNRNIKNSHAAEAYYRWQWREGLGLTADIQYQHDDLRAGPDPRGWVLGVRLALEF